MEVYPAHYENCLAESLVFAIPHQSARVYLIPQVVDCGNCSMERLPSFAKRLPMIAP